jgi:hypothetical protein
MTSKEKAVEIAQNINKTLLTLKDSVIGSNAIRGNGIWSGTKPSRSLLERKLTTLCKQHDINKEDL